MSKPHGLRLFLVAAVVALASACTPEIRIERSKPARLNLAPGKRLAVQVDPDNQPTRANLADQALSKNMAIEPVRQELTVGLQRTTHAVVDRSGAEMLVYVRPTEWEFEPGSRKEKVGSGADAGTKTIVTGVGTLHAHLEVYNLSDQTGGPLFADTYWSRAEVDLQVTPGKTEMDALNHAARKIASRFVDDITPPRVWMDVELDDDDSLVDEAIELCKNGNFEGAHAMLSDLAKQHPNNGPVLYNLSVLEEARGNYDEAESLLQRATAASPKPLYYSAIQRIRESKRDAIALEQVY